MRVAKQGRSLIYLCTDTGENAKVLLFTLLYQSFSVDVGIPASIRSDKAFTAAGSMIHSDHLTVVLLQNADMEVQSLNVNFHLPERVDENVNGD